MPDNIFVLKSKGSTEQNQFGAFLSSVTSNLGVNLSLCAKILGGKNYKIDSFLSPVDNSQSHKIEAG